MSLVGGLYYPDYASALTDLFVYSIIYWTIFFMSLNRIITANRLAVKVSIGLQKQNTVSNYPQTSLTYESTPL